MAGFPCLTSPGCAQPTRPKLTGPTGRTRVAAVVQRSGKLAIGAELAHRSTPAELRFQARAAQQPTHTGRDTTGLHPSWARDAGASVAATPNRSAVRL
jgi:hypothetical protein